jgi:hypothetical protein
MIQTFHVLELSINLIVNCKRLWLTYTVNAAYARLHILCVACPNHKKETMFMLCCPNAMLMQLT